MLCLEYMYGLRVDTSKDAAVILKIKSVSNSSHLSTNGNRRFEAPGSSVLIGFTQC